MVIRAKVKRQIESTTVKKGFFRDIKKNGVLLIMLIPGVLFTLAFGYLPMVGVLLAFKDINYSKGIFASDWVGLKNFEFFMKTPDAYVITRNTILYNGAFIILGLILSVFFAIALSEITNKRTSKVYQTIMFFPYFLSWVVVGYLSYALFNSSYGFINKSILEPLGIEGITWFTTPKYWPAIITAFHFWKGLGYSSVVYLAAIVGIDVSYYEAAAISGASRLQQIYYITLPSLKPLMIMMTILNIGKIFNADFGLFYQTTMNSGALYSVSNVIDTYVFRALRVTGDLGMASAASLYQSVVGFVLVLAANQVVRKLDNENSLF